MGKKKKRRKRKLAARVEKIRRLAVDIFSATISNLITEIILKWLGF